MGDQKREVMVGVVFVLKYLSVKLGKVEREVCFEYRSRPTETLRMHVEVVIPSEVLGMNISEMTTQDNSSTDRLLQKVLKKAAGASKMEESLDEKTIYETLLWGRLDTEDVGEFRRMMSGIQKYYDKLE